MKIRFHHRLYPFRQPREEEEHSLRGDRIVWMRFLKQYLRTDRKAILICLLLTALNANAIYLIAYYGRVVVDRVLMVQASPLQTSNKTTVERDRQPTNPTQEKSITHRLEPHGWIIQHNPEAARDLTILFLLYLATVLILNYITRVSLRTSIVIARRMVAAIRSDLHEKILHLPLAYHKTHTPGRLLSRITSDIEQIQNMSQMLLRLSASTFSMIIIGLIIVMITEWRIGCLLIAVLPLYFAVATRLRPNIRQVNRELSHTNSCLYGLAAQKLEAVKAVQACHRFSGEKLHFHRLAAVFLRDGLTLVQLRSRLQWSAEIISCLAATGVLTGGAWLVLKGELTIGRMLFLYETTAILFAPVMQLSWINILVSNIQVLLRRVYKILDEPLEIEDSPDSQHMSIPMKSGIRIKNITFNYPDEDRQVLNNVSLFVPAGKWTCLIGESGSGKSTLLNLVARIDEPVSGSISYDGIPLEKIKTNSLRTHTGLVPQEARIFSGTIRTNICYGRPQAEPAEIIAAAKAADLHQYIMEEPVKYETLIGEKGVSLSGGQRQRLSIARALITQPEIIFLDDCTSALDSQTEKRIQKTLSHVLANRTALIVSQRISMAALCDKVAVLKNGQIIECGTPKQLRSQNGYFADLERRQTDN